MEQHEFIWMANNMGIGIVTQDESGHTEANLRPNIYITHDYNGNNLMLLTFKETREFYKIKTKDELEEIFKRVDAESTDMELQQRVNSIEIDEDELKEAE